MNYTKYISHLFKCGISKLEKVLKCVCKKFNDE